MKKTKLTPACVELQIQESVLRLRRAALWFGTVTMIGLALASPRSAKAQELTTLYDFNARISCTTGPAPDAVLTQGTDGNFYGTTCMGGTNSDGTVYKMAADGTVTVLYNFCSQSGCTDGRNPYVGLTQGSDGNFYGTAGHGGANGDSWGTVFRITSEGALTTLYNFCSLTNCTDGWYPEGRLIQATDGNFYGTTSEGGANGSYGTAFKITPSGLFTSLYSFCSLSNCADGEYLNGGLVQATDGNFYGVTLCGGSGGTSGHFCSLGSGTVFKITSSGQLTTLYSFCSQTGCADGAEPEAVLVQGADGNLYGTASFGGLYGGGIAFKITLGGVLTSLYNFCATSGCVDGQYPNAGLVQGADGNFYGPTALGGANSQGTLFKITPSGGFVSLYSFCSQSGCADGEQPQAALIQAADGSFYSTTRYGGANSYGTIYKLTLLPIANVSPSSLTFASQDVGTASPPQAVTLSNTGFAALAVSNVATSGDFAETDNCDGSVSAGGSCTINVTFKPTGTGTRNGMLTVTDNSNGVPGSQQTVSLTGTGINPGGTVSPTSLSFGNQVINTTTAAKKVTLTSSGTTPLMNINISITGAKAGDFAQSNNCPSTLNVGSKCTIKVTFTPSGLGAETATLDVNDNAANSPQTVALSGTGIAPVTLTPISANFGNVAVDTPSAAKSFTLKNNQSVALGISSIGFTGANAGDFSNGGTCGSTLAAKASCTISVTFSPTLIGAESATLTVNENAPPPYNTLSASLTGTGIAQATVSPASLTYAPQTVGTQSSPKNVTLHNNLSTSLTGIGFTFTGADPGDYFVSSTTCGASLAAKSSCTVSVVFKPTAKGTRTATLDVNDSANNSPQTASLTGTGK